MPQYYVVCVLPVVAVVLAVSEFSLKEVILTDCLCWLKLWTNSFNLPIVKQVITLFYSFREIYNTIL